MKKIIALYLPQYHEFKENNEFWGQGFTEWTCVRDACPKISSHRIKKPHPDIGYYSLLDINQRRRQAEIAKKYNIYAFCYYHYWFGDRVLMDAPLQLMLKDGEPNLPFCFSWANEPWTRRMNGGNGELLVPNNYGGKEEWEAHLQYLLPYFRHENYVKVNNKPVFCIYRLSQIPNYKDRLNYWRERLIQLGLGGLFVVMTIGNFKDDYAGMCSDVDATFDFYPNFLWHEDMIWKIKDNVAFYDMEKIYQRILTDKPVHDVHFKGTMIGFDSSPRSPKRCNVFLKGSPQLYEHHLDRLLSRSKQSFVFINAWNEWGEGCALEPEELDGYGYLEATQRCLGRYKLKI